MTRGRYSSYSEDFRREAVDLSKKTSIRRAAAELDVPVGTLNGWVQNGIKKSAGA